MMNSFDKFAYDKVIGETIVSFEAFLQSNIDDIHRNITHAHIIVPLVISIEAVQNLLQDLKHFAMLFSWEYVFHIGKDILNSVKELIEEGQEFIPTENLNQLSFYGDSIDNITESYFCCIRRILNVQLKSCIKSELMEYGQDIDDDAIIEEVENIDINNEDEDEDIEDIEDIEEADDEADDMDTDEHLNESFRDQDQVKGEMLMSLLDVDALIDGCDGFPFMAFMVYPEHVMYNEQTLVGLNHDQLDMILNIAHEQYPDNAQHFHTIITNMLKYCMVSMAFIDTYIDQSNMEYWILISKHQLEVLKTPGIINEWKDNLDWSGKALNQALTRSDIVNEFFGYIDLNALFKYSSVFSEDDINRMITQVPDDVLPMIMRAQPISENIIESIKTWMTNAYGPTHVHYAMSELQHNPHLTPFLAYKYREYFCIPEALQLAGKYQAGLALCSMEKNPTPFPSILSKMIISEYL